jgi:hypothetical protein
MRAVKLLMGPTFDVFIGTSGLHSSALKSTAFVEAILEATGARSRRPPAGGVNFGHQAPLMMNHVQEPSTPDDEVRKSSKAGNTLR